MKNLPSVAGIGCLIYALLIIIFISSRTIALLNLAQNSSETGPLSYTQMIPLLSMSLISLGFIVLNSFLSFYLIKRRRRITCMVLAVILCFGFPLGTVLGVFIIILLTRPGIKKDFTS
jgi:hypothetical protein